MPDKDPYDSQYSIWIIIIIFSVWGGGDGKISH